MIQTTTTNGSTDVEHGGIASPLSTPSSPSSWIVDFSSPEDKYNPLNWAFSKRTYTSLLYSLTSLGSVWASTAYDHATMRSCDEAE